MDTLQETNLDVTADDVIVRGSTWAAIWHMSWPMLVNMIVISIASFADVWVAGQMGPQVLAAIGVGGQVWFLMVLTAIALSTGATALVSRFWGAGEYEQAVEAARQSIIFASMFGIVSASIGILLSKPILIMVGADKAVQELGWQFLKVDLWSQVPFTVLWVLNSIFRAKGNAKIPMLIWIMMTSLVVVLDVVFCLGPMNLGIAGIGWSWLIAGAIGTTVSLYVLSKTDIGHCLDFRPVLKSGPDWSWFMRLVRIGIPACIQDFSWVAGNFVIFAIFAHTIYPTAAQAAWSAAFRLEELVAGMPIYALSMAVGTIVGQNLGAKQPERASRAGWQVAMLGAGYNFVVGLLMVAFASQLASCLTKDANVALYTQQYFQICGWAEPFIATWFILFGAMQGAGYTKWPMIITVAALTVVRLPICWYLTLGMKLGPIGTWYGVICTAVLIGLLAAWRFWEGSWQKQKI